MQQCLPLAVLKLSVKPDMNTDSMKVATVLTACGIETGALKAPYAEYLKVATVLTACGIETKK